MRVLHISTFDTGAAGRAMLQWHAQLKRAGIESRVLCFQKSLENSDIYAPSLLADRTESIKSRPTQERWIDRCRTSFSDNFFSQPFYARSLIGEELVEWAEVLHFHWIARSLDISSLADLAKRGKALILTPHDLWAITGGCHYPAGCQKFREGCRACPMVTEESQRLVEIAHRFKREEFSCGLHALICPSNWIRNETIRCPGFQTIDSIVIPYAWDAEGLWPEQKETAKTILNVPTDRKWVLFVADDLDESRTGFRDFLQLIKAAEQRLQAAGRQNGFGVMIAARTEAIHESDFGIPVIKLGLLSNVNIRRNAYSAADFLAYTGSEDNLPDFILESLACGTPVLAYAAGGVGELVRSGENGELAAVGDIKGLAGALFDLIMNPIRAQELAARARNFVEINFGNQETVLKLRSAYDTAIAKAGVKTLRPDISDACGQYQAFAARALVDLLEGAERRRVELDREVLWLREQLESLHETLEKSFGEIAENAPQRWAELKGEVRWLRGYIDQVSFELGQALLEFYFQGIDDFQGIDEMFAVAPSRVRRQYERVVRSNQDGESGQTDQSPGKRWSDLSTKCFLLKEYFGLPFWKRWFL